MKKLFIDYLTNKIIGFSNIIENSIVFKEDVIVNDNDISIEDVISRNLYYINGKIVKKESLSNDTNNVKDDFSQIDKLEEELNKKNSINQYQMFVDLILEGKSINEVREKLLTLRSEISDLKNQRAVLLDEYKKSSENYWIKKHKENDSTINYKYYSAIVLLIKDENRYLKEWLDWHLALGFDHIYIYDNGSKEKAASIVSCYPCEKQDRITIINWNGIYKNIQEDAYNHFLQKFKQEVRWVIFLDSDEFFRFEIKCNNVNDFLKSYEDYTEIYGYMESHNANGKISYEDKPVRERFTEVTKCDELIYYKNFIQANRIDSMVRHYAHYSPEYHLTYKNENNNKDLFVIEHYYTKSWEEWKEKIETRGCCDPKYLRNLVEFFEYNPDMKFLDTGENTVQKYQAS